MWFRRPNHLSFTAQKPEEFSGLIVSISKQKVARERQIIFSEEEGKGEELPRRWRVRS
jgi:hypothetical protein